MAENDRTVQDKVSDAPALPIVYVAAANACLRDMDANFILVAKFGDLAIFESNVFDSTEDEGWVLGCNLAST